MEKMRYFAIFLIFLMATSCRSKALSHSRETASVVATTPSWSEQYLSAQKSCKKLAQFKKQPAPTEELTALTDIKYKEKCRTYQNLLKNLKQPWLKKDIIIKGLRSTKNPEVFADYYSEYLKLPNGDKTKIEFIERAMLFKKILVITKDQKIKNKLLWLFPALYNDFNVAIPKEKMFEAAYGLRMLRRFEESKKIYQKIIVDNKAALKKDKTKSARQKDLVNLSRAYDFIRLIYRVQERKQKGIVEYKKSYHFFENYFLKHPQKEFATPYTDAVVQLARDIWTEGRVDEARKILENTVKKASGKAALDQVYWVLGRMKQEKKDYAGAIEYFKKALQENPPKDFELKLLWLVSWNYKKNNQLEDALKSFDEFVDKSNEYQDQANYYKGLFWSARIYKDLKKNSKAKDILEKVAEENIGGYYGQLARMEVDPDFFGKELKTEDQPIDPEIVDDSSKMTIKTLLEISEYDVVAEYLTYLWKNLDKSDRRKIKNRIAFFQWADSAQLYKENLQLIEILDDDSKKEILNKYPELLFPEPYLDIVDKYSQQFQMPREFVYSLMRQESLFDKNARSQADAFGLLQLLPQIAKKYRHQAKISFKDPSELYRPGVIIPLGIAHLKHLLKIFNGSMMLTAASYNAGVDPVKGWIKTRYDGNSYEFIEDIPYLETEYYTKLIYRNLSYYIRFHPKMKKNEKIDILKRYFDIKAQ